MALLATDQRHLFPLLDLTSRSDFTVHSSLQSIHHSLGLFELCRSTQRKYHNIILVYTTDWNGKTVRKEVCCWQYAELTCKQDSELVTRNRNNSGLCGAWLCSLRLQFKLNHWLIHLPQLAGAESVVDAPGHTVQASHWNSLQSRKDGTLQSVLSRQDHTRQLSTSVTFVLVFEKGKTDRNTYASGSSLWVCLATQSVCLHMICRVPLCVLKEWMRVYS